MTPPDTITSIFKRYISPFVDHVQMSLSTVVLLNEKLTLKNSSIIWEGKMNKTWGIF